MGKKAEKSFYNGVVEANEGIEVKDVKRLFLWCTSTDFSFR